MSDLTNHARAASGTGQLTLCGSGMVLIYYALYRRETLTALSPFNGIFFLLLWNARCRPVRTDLRRKTSTKRFAI